jgi:hypothetical protein
MRILIGIVAVIGSIGVLDLLASRTGEPSELRAPRPAASAAKVTSSDGDEAHFRATLATLDTQLYSVAPRERFVAPASRIKTDRLTVRQAPLGEMDMPTNLVMTVDEMGKIRRALEIDEMGVVRRAPEIDEMGKVRRALEIDEMVAPKRALEIDEMGQVKRAPEVDERAAPKRALAVADMSSPSHPTKVSTMDDSPQIAAVQRVLDRLQ